MKSRRAGGRTVARVRPAFRSTTLAAAVSLAASASAAADEWKPTIETFVRQGSGRTLGGVDAVLPFRQGGTSLFFADVRAHAASRDANEFNLGLGYRGLTAESTWALGGYAAWDRRRSPLGNDFMQVTLGAEARSDRFDLRTNLYRPITEKKPVGLGGTNHFSGFAVYRSTVFEEAMGGYDVEAGFRLPIDSLGETRVFVAGYSFHGKDVAPHADGGRIRFEIRPIQSLAIGLSSQHDKVFGTRNSFELRYTFDRPARREARSLRERMAEPWTRDIDVVVSRPTESTRPAEAVAALDRVVHIDNSKASGGDGSFEHPYASVESCLADKCSDAGYGTIRLWQGISGTTAYSPIRLQDGQTLWGQGYDIFSDVSSPGLRPVLDGDGYWTPVVSLATDGTRGNIVAGVKIRPGVISVASATSSGGPAYQWGSVQYGIEGQNTGGTVRIVGNEISNGGAAGIALINTSIDSNADFRQRVEIANNEIHITSFGAGVLLRNESNFRSGGVIQDAVLAGNTIDSTGDGVDLYNSNWGGGQSIQVVEFRGNAISARYESLYLDNSAGDHGRATQIVALRGNSLTSYWDALYAANGAAGRCCFAASPGGSGDTTLATQVVTATANVIVWPTSEWGWTWPYGVRFVNAAYYGASSFQTAVFAGNRADAQLWTWADNWTDVWYGGTAIQNLVVGVPLPSAQPPRDLFALPLWWCCQPVGAGVPGHR